MNVAAPKRSSDTAESDKRYRILFESSRDAIMTLEPPTWEFTSANPATLKLFGAKSEAEFISTPPWKVSPKNQPDGKASSKEAKKMINLAMKKGSAFFEWTHRRLNGDNFFASVLLTRVKVEGKVFLQATVRDITAAKTLEESLISSNDRFKSVFESVSDAIVIFDKKSRVLDVNKIVTKLTGYSKKDIVGKNILSQKMFPKKSLALMAVNNIRRRLGYEVAPYEVEARTKKGKKLILEISGAPLKKRDKIAGTVAVLRDVTNRKDAEKLEFESDLLKLQSKASVDGTIITDGRGEIISVNKQFCKMWGVSRRMCTSKSPSEVVLAALKSVVDPSAIKERIKKLTLNSVSKTINELELKDGRTFVEYSVPLKDSDGQFLGRMWLIRDISYLKNAEKELAESKKKLEEALNAIPDVFFVLDSSGKLVNWNKRLEDLTGYGPKKLEKLNVVKLFDKKIGKNVKAAISKGLTKGDVSVELPFKTKGGTKIPYLFSAHRVYREKSHKPFLTGTGRDITLQKTYEKSLKARADELSRAYEQLKALDVAKDDFMMLASHELRTPLFPIKGYAESLLHEDLGELNAEQKKSLEIIHNNTSRLLSLVEDILTITKLEAGKLKMYPSKIKLEKLIADVVDEYRPRFRERKLKLRYSPNKLPSIKADGERIKQVMRLLLSNSFKFTKKGGVTINAKASSSEIIITIKDTGIGIAKKNIPHLFEKFFQAGLPPTGEKGFGLGLTLAKNIIDLHKGTMDAKSKLGKGTTVTVTLPR